MEMFERDLELHYATHDPNCERFLLYGYEHWYGFGSQYNNMLLDFPMALWSNRTLVMMRNWLVDYRCAAETDNGNYFSCFKDVFLGPQTCKPEVVAQHRANFSNLQEWYCYQQPPFTCYREEVPVLKVGR